MSVSDFSGYQIGKQILNTAQIQMDVAGQNIGNSSTTGYSQQVANIQPAPLMVNSGSLQIGGGAMVTGIQRQDSPYVDSQMVSTSSGLGAATTLAAGLGQLQNVLNESNGQGISTALDAMTNAFTALAANPSQASLQQGAVSAAQAVATDIQQRATQLAGLQTQADQQAQQAVTQMNSLAQSVASLNTQIASALAQGQQPNQLMDQRQQDLLKLGTVAGADSSQMANGMVNVNIGGHWLVEQGQAAKVNTAPDAGNPAISDFTWSDNGQTFAPTGGNAQGALTLRDQDVAGAITNLNSLSAAVTADYNAVQASGYAPNSATPGGPALFTGTSAINMAVNPALIAAPSQLATAQSPNSPGDGSNAAAFAALGTKASAALGQTYDSALGNWTTEVGASAALATQQQSTQQANLNQLQNLWSSISGVDLNQQAVQLSQYEQVYQAGAKYVGTLDMMMQSLFMELSY